ncbi:MAG: LysE family translocator [Lentilitoribacter sp.]
MPIENYVAFVIASIIVLIIPGPSIIMAVGQAIAHGKRAVAPTVWGVVAGDAIATTLSMLGVGTILLASSEAFQIIKWAGVIYLIYIGILMIRNAGKAETSDTQSADQLKSPQKMFQQALIVTAINPKGIIFFIAFVPQFISPTSSFLPQAAICITTFLVLAFVNMWLYTAFAAHARQGMQNPSVLKWAERMGGSLLISAGVLSAAKT